MLKQLLIAGAAASSAAAAAGFVMARSAFHEWGVVPGDAAKPLPGDDLVPEPKAADTRTIEIEASPERVWPWLVQMGYGRGGWYSYDQLDMDHPSLDRIDLALQALAVGDVVPTHPSGGFEVKVLEPDHALVLFLDRPTMLAQEVRAREAGAPVLDETEATDEAGVPAGDDTIVVPPKASANVRATGAYLGAAMPGDFAASWAFVLEPAEGGRTRLIERFRVAMAPPASGRPIPPVATSMLGFGVFVMTRRQMLGIKSRVEGRPEPGFLAEALRRRHLGIAPA